MVAVLMCSPGHGCAATRDQGSETDGLGAAEADEDPREGIPGHIADALAVGEHEHVRIRIQGVQVHAKRCNTPGHLQATKLADKLARSI